MTELPSAAGRRHHEWEESYGDTPAPWDIGRPQSVFVALADARRIKGRVLDAGCGTGEHALMAAERGMEATGVDVASNAIAIAQRKAEARGLTSRFVTGDALRLGDLEEQFDTVLDCGLYHSFDDDDRARYVDSLRDVVKPGGQVLLCCFSNEQPGDWGPRRIHQDELRASFADGWSIQSIEPAQLEVSLDPPTAHAWLMTAARRH
jgi:SAM-dependent methyltransferase